MHHFDNFIYLRISPSNEKKLNEVYLNFSKLGLASKLPHSISFNYSSFDNVYIDEVAEKLLNSIDFKEFNKLKETYDLSYSLVVKVDLDKEEKRINPSLSLNKENLEKLAKLGADYDLDYYII